MATWGDCRNQFKPEGSLRDIYVFDTSLADCHAFLSEVRNWGYYLTFEVEGEPRAVPEDYAEIVSLRDHYPVLLKIHASDVRIHCHFFTDDEMEFDLDPAQVRSEESFAALLRFLERLGDSLRKEVFVTHENSPYAKILSYCPAKRDFRSYPVSSMDFRNPV